MTKLIANKQKSAGPDDEGAGRYIAEIMDNRKLIIIITTSFLIIAILYSFLATPVYQADALIQVEQKQGNAVLDSLNQILPDSQPISAPEIALLQSRMVVGKTVDDLNLQISVQKINFPIIGKGLARLLGNDAGSISVTRLNIPTTRDEKPGKITLKIIDDKRFSIDYGNTSALGEVGKLLQKDRLTLLVSESHAKPGEEFEILQYTRLAAIDRLLQNLVVADQGKDTGMLELKQTGEDKKQITAILDNISYHYVTQNIDRQAAQDAKSLEFLNQQLPKVRSELDSSENKLNTYRRQKDSVDLSLEAKSVLEQVVNVDNQLNELTFREAEVSQLFTKEHPTYKALLAKRGTLQQEREKLNKQVSSMPSTQQEVLRLSRDVEAGRAVYMQLLNRQQELSIAKSSAIGNVRIVDNAVTVPKAVRPQKVILILASIIAGLIFSASLILIRVFFHRGIDSTEQLEQAGLSVYASIPKSDWMVRHTRSKTSKAHLLAVENPADLAIEAIRNLRTSLHFNMLNAKKNVLMISGATSEAGKTFISTNLAAIISIAGKKILFIDADMRRGKAHEIFHISNDVGLADVLTHKVGVADAIKKVQQGKYNFDFMSRGKAPDNPAELLMGENLLSLLDWAKARYDLVIIDTPPVLAVSDAVLIGKYAGTLLLVARYQTNTVREIETSINRFTQCDIHVQACILNMVENSFRSYYTYGYRHNTYAYDDKKIK
ncbi:MULTISPECIES: polysaccharide biosynthesis tyrosine autokinase [Erwinia]|uniref:polysaccharide biosynthesis tyrosine autokinase n=1 Tax=Erwinia TaxID=551 RepID=UPI0013318236|nr:polysaccharide biosynthesis tyrosine autokinase [Erwinia rhapontici]MBP2156283.1 tyrosine-protein kinase Etk/Wzc [Erwinia rhapontici]